MSEQLKERIRALAKKKDITDKEEINSVIRAYLENDCSLIEDNFTPKMWKAFKAQIQSDKPISLPSGPSPPPPRPPMLYFRCPLGPPHIASSSASSVKAVVMGPCGIGKTCLVNHICGSDLATGQTQSSLTRNVTQLKCRYNYKVPFIIYDSPGTTAHTDKLQHAIHLRQLLQFKPINTVLILVRYSKRADDIVNEFFRQIKMLQGFQTSVVFVVTHIDQAEQYQKCMGMVDKMMKQLQIKNQVIYMSNKYVKVEELVNKLYQICAAMPKRHIKVNQYTFHKYYNLKKEQTESMYFKKFEQEIDRQMEETTQSYIQYANSLPADKQRDAIFQDLELTLKDQLLDLISSFQNKYKETMVAMQFYSSYYTLQLKSNEMMKHFQNKTRNLHGYSLIQHTHGNVDIRNLIKKCPNPDCGLIWFRIQSCPNTTCGNRPSCIFDFTKSVFYRFTFFRDRKTKKFTMIRNDRKTNLNKDQLNQKCVTNSKPISERMKGKSVGCGQNMNFDSLDVLPNIEELLMNLYQATSIEEVIARFNADKEIEKTRLELQKRVNAQFSSFLY